MGGVQFGGREGLGNWGDKVSVNGEDVHTFSNLFLKILKKGAVTTEAESLFQYFTTLTERADPLLRRWLVAATMNGGPDAVVSLRRGGDEC